MSISRRKGAICPTSSRWPRASTGSCRAPDFYPAITSIKAAVRHVPGQTVELRLDGSPVSPLNFYGTSENRAHTVAVSLWRGVDIPEGPSQLVAIVRNADGAEVDRLTRDIHFGGGPVRAEYDRDIHRCWWRMAARIP